MSVVTHMLLSRIEDGELDRDEAQILACGKLDDLLGRLEDYTANNGFMSRLFKRVKPPIGLYLWGRCRAR